MMPSAICFARNQMVAEGTFPPQTGLGSLSPGAPLTDVANIWGDPLALSTEKAVGLPELHISGSPVDVRLASLLPFVTLLALGGIRELSRWGQGDIWSSEAHSAAGRQGRGKPAPTSGQGEWLGLGAGELAVEVVEVGAGPEAGFLESQRSWKQAHGTCYCASGTP